MAERISIRDLAKIAAVSRTTVSLALRDSARVAAPVRERIQQLARQHNYRSHPMVAALMQQIRGKRTVQDEEVIAFVTSGLSADQWKKWSWNLAMWRGAFAEANRLGFRLEEFWAGPGAIDAENLARILYHRGIRGICFAPMPWPHPIFSIPWERFVAVACTPSTGIAELPVVRSNHFRGIQLLLSKLRELGAKSIGIVLSEHEDLRVQRGWSAGIHSFCVDERFCMDNQETKVHLLHMARDDDCEGFASWFGSMDLDVLVGMHPDMHALMKRIGLTPGIDIACASLNVLDEQLGTIAGLYQNPAYLGQRAIDYISKGLCNESLGLPERAESISIEGRFVEGISLRPLLEDQKRPKKKPVSKRRTPPRVAKPA